MGFCKRCGEISSLSKCRKCGGMVVASAASGLGEDNLDRWSSAYLKTANGDIEATLKRLTISSRPSSVLGKRGCNDCGAALSVNSANFEQETLEKFFCSSCYTKRFSKGDCRACLKPVISKESSWVSHGQRVWHKNCFRCRHCDSLVPNPLVDLVGRPTCEDCLLSKKSESHTEQPIVHATPPSSPEPVRVASPISVVSDHYSPYIRSDSPSFYGSDRNGCYPIVSYSLLARSGSSVSSISDITTTTTTTNTSNGSRPSTPTSTISCSSRTSPMSPEDILETGTVRYRRDRAMSSVRRTFVEPPLFRRERAKSSPRFTFVPVREHPENVDSEIAYNKQVPVGASPRGEVESTTAANGLHETAADKEVNSPHNTSVDLTTQDETVHEYKYPIQSPEKMPTPTRRERALSTPSRPHTAPSAIEKQGILTRSPHSKRGSVQHGQSRYCTKCREVIQGSSVRLKSGDSYHIYCFTCAGCHQEFTESEFVWSGGKPYHFKCVPKSTEVTSIKCAKCDLAISDKFIRIDGANYHLTCFCCEQCHKTLQPNSHYFEMDGNRLCTSCGSHLSVPGPAEKIVPSLRNNNPAPVFPNDRLSEPPRMSSLFSSRTKPLPKLGGMTHCPRCRLPVAFMEQTPGPRATKWHRKCLKCLKCRKELDSGANVTPDGVGPFCRACFNKYKVDPSICEKVVLEL
ncbi:uncharacterized protein VTP21DRAFT_6443 [Calcarisporiella thermophila]|uniref:uncharacterized protein n=1 Tax=Calcarisporiella thermophila TaxID=911321 RepID=UPI003743DA88